VSAVLTAVLFVGACLGHLVWMIFQHNWWYGQPLPKHTGKLVHLIHALLILGGWVLFWFVGPDLTPLFRWPREVWWAPLLAAYVAACWLAGFVLAPVITLRRALRGRPRVVVAVGSRILDVVKELGMRPEGRGKRRALTRLPRNEVFRVELAERTLALPRLPAAWDGLTVLHLSDLHLCGTPDRDFYRLVLQRCAAWEPDLIALTGDVADSLHHHGWILPALGWLRWKTAAFAILGNHDHWYDPPGIRRRLEELGMTVLPNVGRTVEVRGEPLVVIGNEWPWLKPPPDLSDCPEGPFRLCLSHTPDNLPWARRVGIDLMLSGHVHGGQVRFPLIGSLLVPSIYGRRYDCGTFHEPPTVLHVSRGLSGEWPIRYGCMPEATLLTLRCGLGASRER
jgi:predicted MPP superfamily phosphohydrolase